MTEQSRFEDWEYPEIEDGKPTKYNWIVQHKDYLALGYKTDIGAFTYINAKYKVIIEDFVQIGSHCSIYSVSTIDNKIGGNCWFDVFKILDGRLNLTKLRAFQRDRIISNPMTFLINNWDFFDA